MTLQRLQVGRYSCVSISFIYVVAAVATKTTPPNQQKKLVTDSGAGLTHGILTIKEKRSSMKVFSARYINLRHGKNATVLSL
jgi:hypothetical protein